MTFDEKIADAVARAIYHGKPRNKPWDLLTHEFKNQYRKAARAAITAYQEEAWQEKPSDAVDALASSWASIDGKLGYYDRERGLTLKEAMKANLPGHYAGYQAEAAEMIRRLRARGFEVVSLSPAPKASP